MRVPALLIAAVVGCAATTWLMMAIANRTEVPYVQAGLDGIEALDALMTRPETSRAGFALFGDSLLLDSRTPDTGVATRLSRWADEQHSATLVQAVAPGLSVATHYFLVDQVLRHEPRAVIVALNLRSFSGRWQALERVEFAGWVEARRWPEAFGLPLAGIGLSADQIIFQRWLVSAGGLDAWHWLQREQVRFAHAYWQMEYALRTHLLSEPGMAFFQRWKTARLRAEKTVSNRATPQAVRIYLGAALDGLSPNAPGLEFLDALLGRLNDGEKPILVYVSPINVEHLRAIGSYDPDSMQRTLDEIRNVCDRQRATLLDLHALLPDSAFADHQDHLAQADHWDSPEGSSKVATRVERALEALLKAQT